MMAGTIQAVVTTRGRASKPALMARRLDGQFVGEVERLMAAMPSAMKRQEIRASLGLKHEEHFRAAYLAPALRADLVEMTIPDKPTSRLQKCRPTNKGRAGISGRTLPRVEEAVRGPLALGYGCHFGLGLFTPAPDA